MAGVATPQRQTLVADEVEGEASQDWSRGRDPGMVCQVLDDQGGYAATTVQDYPGPDLTAGPSVTRDDISGAVLKNTSSITYYDETLPVMGAGKSRWVMPV